MLKARLSDHRGYINQQTGDHFNLPGHSLANMKVPILEAVKKNGDLYRKEIETYFINKFNTYFHGLNKEMGEGGGFSSLTLCDLLINKEV